MNILILDTETTGLDPAKDHIIEIGAVLWSVDHACILTAWSDLVEGDGNAAVAINMIPAAALKQGRPIARAVAVVDGLAKRADALMAHRAEFDRGFLEAAGFRPSAPWVCSKFDVDWPSGAPGDSLVTLALAHGCGVVTAHRALTDCLTLARILERVAEHCDVPAMLAKAMRPRVVVEIADRSFDADRNAKAKALGFGWVPEVKAWRKRILPEDIAALPFVVTEVA